MTDTPKIAPALTPDEWAGLRARGVLLHQSTLDDILSLDEDDMRRAIAMANDALQDDDPRKITRGMVSWLREEADVLKRNGAGAGSLFAAKIADALESYLPPPA